MTTRHTLASLALALAAFLVYSRPVFAQQAAPGTVAFQGLDRNRDEKLTRDEVPSAESFRAADANKDGAVTLKEFRRFLANRQKPSTPAPAKPGPKRVDANALFETVVVQGFTDVKGEANGLALGDLNRDGLLDIVRTHEAGITVLLNRGGFRFEPHTIQVRNPDGSDGQVTRKAQVPNLVDFNNDGYLDLSRAKRASVDVKVTLPSGKSQIFSEIAANKVHSLTLGQPCLRNRISASGYCSPP